MPRKIDPELSRSGWIRQQVLQKPDITLEQLQKAYDKTDFPRKDRPKAPQVLYQATSQIRKRWGVEDLAAIPRKPNGELNLSGMVRLYIDMFPEDTNADCVAYFAADGLELGSTIFSQIKSKIGKGTITVKTTDDSPDENQDAGPRAGAPTKRRKKGKRRKKTEEAVESPALDKYAEMEIRLDKLIADAESVKNWALVNDLKNARRRAGAGVLAYS